MTCEVRIFNPTPPHGGDQYTVTGGADIEYFNHSPPHGEGPEKHLAFSWSLVQSLPHTERRLFTVWSVDTVFNPLLPRRDCCMIPDAEIRFQSTPSHTEGETSAQGRYSDIGSISITPSHTRRPPYRALEHRLKTLQSTPHSHGEETFNQFLPPTEKLFHPPSTRRDSNMKNKNNIISIHSSTERRPITV